MNEEPKIPNLERTLASLHKLEARIHEAIKAADGEQPDQGPVPHDTVSLPVAADYRVQYAVVSDGPIDLSA